MSKQPEALRLADLAGGYTGLTVDEANQAAAELRRLHADVERLRKLVPDAIELPVEDGTEYDYCSGRSAGYAEGWNACRATMLAANEAHARFNVTLVRENSEPLAQRNQLLEALSYIEGLAMADEPRDLPTIATTAHEAIAKVGGRKS